MMTRDQIEDCRRIGAGAVDLKTFNALCDTALAVDDVKSDMDSFPRAARRAVFSVLMERGRQDVKWGADRTLDDRFWATILGEEFGEVCRAVLEGGDGCPGQLREELVQVAAVAVAAIEDIDRRLR